MVQDHKQINTLKEEKELAGKKTNYFRGGDTMTNS